MQIPVHTKIWRTDETREGGEFMKTTSRFFLLFVLTALCTIIFPLAAAAKPLIRFHTQHVYLHQGNAELVGFFENTGDEMAYVKRYEFDLIITADNGKQLWTTYGTQHYVNSVRVPAGRRISYTINVRNSHIPEYHGKYRWRTENTHTYWSKTAG